MLSITHSLLAFTPALASSESSTVVPPVATPGPYNLTDSQRLSTEQYPSFSKVIHHLLHLLQVTPFQNSAAAFQLSGSLEAVVIVVVVAVCLFG